MILFFMIKTDSIISNVSSLVEKKLVCMFCLFYYNANKFQTKKAIDKIFLERNSKFSEAIVFLIHNGTFDEVR